eukprot:comp12779_c0_seq1/m.7911 comp12779_c0_seq1/g.7911  ORF comp12779_c0_seq1/g.7911 comp12779_c0_seq1/m.7911 type:complete len:134 (-) comp12779_c0_seq1:280-681(-)
MFPLVSCFVNLGAQRSLISVTGPQAQTLIRPVSLSLLSASYSTIIRGKPGKMMPLGVTGDLNIRAVLDNSDDEDDEGLPAPQRKNQEGKTEAKDENMKDGEWVNPKTGERGGPKGPEPVRYGDWEKGGRCYDF